VKQVDVPSGTGTFGILPNHVPTLAVLRPGVVTVFEDEGTKKYFGRHNNLKLSWEQYCIGTLLKLSS
jgi:F-type H+-transporting ATPase subunit delta